MKIRILLYSLLASILIGTGYASWQFSGDSEVQNSIGLNIKQFEFSWTDSDVLDDETYEYSSEFPDALNGLEDPDSEQGQALAAAIEAKRSGADWLGNMDEISNVSDNLSKVLNVSEDCSYIIKIKSDGSYELYVTYEDLSSKRIYQRFGTVYKTVYQKDESGKYKAVQSYKGTATVTYYDTRGGQWQRSFNTDDFKAS